MVIITHPNMLFRGEKVLINMIHGDEFSSADEIKHQFQTTKFVYKSKEWVVFYNSMRGHYTQATISSQCAADKVKINF